MLPCLKINRIRELCVCHSVFHITIFVEEQNLLGASSLFDLNMGLCVSVCVQARIIE